MLKTLYDFTNAFIEMVGDALNNLSPEDFEEFMDSIPMVLDSYACGSNLYMFLNTSKSSGEWWDSVSTVEEVDDFMDALHSNDESGKES